MLVPKLPTYMNDLAYFSVLQRYLPPVLQRYLPPDR